MTDLDRLDALAAEITESEVVPLTVYEIEAIRNRDVNAKTPARTWAVEDRRRLLVTLDAAVRERDELRAALLDHEPTADYGYEIMGCVCGWQDDSAVGVRPIDPESKTWLEHILRVIDQRAALHREAGYNATLSEPLDPDRVSCAADESSCFDADCPKHGLHREAGA